MNFEDKLQEAYEAGYHQALSESKHEVTFDSLKRLFDSKIKDLYQSIEMRLEYEYEKLPPVKDKKSSAKTELSSSEKRKIRDYFEFKAEVLTRDIIQAMNEFNKKRYK